MRRINLSGTWTLNSPGVASRDIPAEVPGDTHSALLAAGIIKDPYYACNETELQHLNRESWDYRRCFEITADDMTEQAVYLVCESLDTVADIFINEKHVAYSDNMFSRLVIDVKPLLHTGKNDIRIHFHSAEKEACRRAAELPWPIPTISTPIESPHRNLVRKAQCHAGWDWGCCLMTAGIAGAIGLEAGPGRIEYVYTDQAHGKGECRLTVHVEYRSAISRDVELRVEIDDRAVTQQVAARPGLNSLCVEYVVPHPRLWWPNGCGEQYLYRMKVSVGQESRSIKLGLRTLEVVSEEDEIGRSMVFRVNGRDVFCKGANWIPCDALPQRQTKDVYEDLLESAALAHMNMIRVWGGGQYEREIFYDLCDEKGLMVWQDFMFACSLYPATKEFRESVRGEARHQVKRLRNHACLAIWCGDNENIGALKWFTESRENRDRYLVAYDRLNHGVLAGVVAECDPGRTFWPSSPCGGPTDYSDCWHSDGRGDMHVWTVWHEDRPFDDYTRFTPRFCSEFGFQSLPSIATIATFAGEDQFNLTSPVMEHHQRNERGNSKILEMFSRYFRIPEGFESLVYLSQVQQAIAIKTAVEYWRTLRPRCMGTLYWQLNDNWPVSSWSSIEYGGSWKILHYAAKRFYAPMIITAVLRTAGIVDVYVVNDHPRSEPAVVRLQINDFNGNTRVEKTLDITTPADGAMKVWSKAVADIAPGRDEVFMTMCVETKSEKHVNELFFLPLKRCNPAKATISQKIRNEGGDLYVDLETDLPAFFVHVEARGLRGSFDDSGFTLLPETPRSLRFYSANNITIEQLARAFNVRHLTSGE